MLGLWPGPGPGPAPAPAQRINRSSPVQFQLVQCARDIWTRLLLLRPFPSFSPRHLSPPLPLILQRRSCPLTGCRPPRRPRLLPVDDAPLAVTSCGEPELRLVALSTDSCQTRHGEVSCDRLRDRQFLDRTAHHGLVVYATHRLGLATRFNSIWFDLIQFDLIRFPPLGFQAVERHEVQTTPTPTDPARIHRHAAHLVAAVPRSSFDSRVLAIPDDTTRLHVLCAPPFESSFHSASRDGTMATNGAPNDDWHPHVFRMPDWVEPVVCSSCPTPATSW